MAVSRRGSSASGLDVSSAGLTDSPRPSNIPTEEAIVYVGVGRVWVRREGRGCEGSSWCIDDQRLADGDQFGLAAKTGGI